MTFEPDTEITPVIFRKWKSERVKDTHTGKFYWHNDGVIALLPAECGTHEPHTCSSYMHVGQHGSCEPHGLMNSTRPATPEEYADLKHELESAPYGYRFRVYKRLQPSFLASRRADLARMR